MVCLYQLLCHSRLANFLASTPSQAQSFLRLMPAIGFPYNNDPVQEQSRLSWRVRGWLSSGILYNKPCVTISQI
jgi:hypothetical protein